MWRHFWIKLFVWPILKHLVGMTHYLSSKWSTLIGPLFTTELILSRGSKSKKMEEEINNDPDFEQNSVDPFDSGESEIDDSGPEDDPPVQRIVDISSYKLS